MYEALKKLIKSVIPDSVFERSKTQLRKVLTCFYKGSTYQCNICEQKLRKFIVLKNGDLICPNCGSLPRTRRLQFLIDQVDLYQKKILHFSPSPSMYARLRKAYGDNYVASDYVGEFEAAKTYNLEAVEEPDNIYDFIICYHVLEHIENDAKAISELYRILKPKGICLVQTPFKSGEIYEDSSIRSPAERFAHFGQEDHVRIYSVEALSARLENAGFKVKELNWSEDPENYYGYKTSETTLLLEK